jgi:hypothetical protein
VEEGDKATRRRNDREKKGKNSKEDSKKKNIEEHVREGYQGVYKGQNIRLNVREGKINPREYKTIRVRKGK